MLPAIYLPKIVHFEGGVQMNTPLNTPNGTIVKIVSFLLS